MGKGLRKAKQCCRGMPFQKQKSIPTPQASFKDKQRANLMAGLRAIGAPLVGTSVHALQTILHSRYVSFV